jgi:hypothetical protein
MVDGKMARVAMEDVLRSGMFRTVILSGVHSSQLQALEVPIRTIGTARIHPSKLRSMEDTRSSAWDASMQ